MPEQFARVRWDWEVLDGLTRMDSDDWPRGFHNRGYPGVVQLWRKPKGGEDRVPMDKDWLLYEKWHNLIGDNGNPTNQNDPFKIFVIAYCAYNKQPPIPINNLPDDFIAYHENVVFCGNTVRVLERKNGSSRIETLYFKDTPPNTKDIPKHLVHQVSAVYNKDEQGNRYVHGGWNPDYSVIISRYENDDPESRGGWLPDEWLDFTNEEAEMPEEPTYPDVTYQDFINAIYQTIQEKGIPGDKVWSYIKALDLEYLAVPDENRDTIIEPEE